MIRLVAALALLATAPGAIQVEPARIQWQPGPATMPAGTQIARLEGDSRKNGIFTIRVKIPAGAQLPPHWHPRDERVTVLTGSVGVGFGERIDASAVTRLGPGSFYVNPAHSRHYVLFFEETVVQITGEGPWETHVLKP